MANLVTVIIKIIGYLYIIGYLLKFLKIDWGNTNLIWLITFGVTFPKLSLGYAVEFVRVSTKQQMFLYILLYIIMCFGIDDIVGTKEELVIRKLLLEYYWLFGL